MSPADKHAIQRLHRGHVGVLRARRVDLDLEREGEEGGKKQTGRLCGPAASVPLPHAGESCGGALAASANTQIHALTGLAGGLVAPSTDGAYPRPEVGGCINVFLGRLRPTTAPCR